MVASAAVTGTGLHDSAMLVCCAAPVPEAAVYAKAAGVRGSMAKPFGLNI